MCTIDVGDSSAKALDLVTVAVNTVAADSVVIKNVAGSTLSVFKSLIDAAPSTLTATQTSTVTTPAWIQSAGRTTVQLTGGQYGAV